MIRSALVVAALLLAARAAPAQEDDGRPSEDEIFGGESVVVEPPGATAPPAGEGVQAREAEIFGGESVVVEPRASTPRSDILADLAESFQIGGLLFLRLDATVFDLQDDLQQGERRDPATEPRLSSRNLLDLYADARPTERLRAYASLRVEFDPTVVEGGADVFGRPQRQVGFLLDQLWLKGDVARLAFFTVGRQRIKWGAGRFWNPTDFVNQQVRDPLDVFDRRIGVDIAKLHVPFEDLGWNFYFLTRFDDARTPWDVGGAARAEIAFLTSEVSVSTSFGAFEPFRVGADVSTGLWLFDLRAEAAATKGVTTPFFTGDLDVEALVFPEAVDRSDEWLLQAVFGGEIQIPYSDQDTVILGGEYFYNDAGYDDATLYPWLLLQGAFTPLYVGRHYAAAYAVLLAPGPFNDSSATVSALGNLSDGSFLTRLDLSTLVLTYVTLNAYAATHFGTEGGELRFGLEVPPIPFVPELEDGFLIPTPLLDVGVGARLAF